MFTKIVSIYKETHNFLAKRWDFTLHRFWQLLSILSIYYFAISGLVALFVLLNIVSEEMYIKMFLGFLALTGVALFLLVLVMFGLALFRKGRKSFDRIIKYRPVDLEGRLMGIEARQTKLEQRLTKLEQRVNIIEKRRRR